MVNDCSRVESTLRNKHNSVAYHYCWWEVAAGVTTIARITTKYNFVDVLTKHLRNSVKDYLFGHWTYVCYVTYLFFQI